VLHTNDLHSQLESGSNPGVGGFANVAAIFNRIKTDDKENGIETLILDAGDFTEGSEFYLANEGREILHIMNAMGYDAATIGNHDWLMGPEHLDKLMGEIPPAFAFLGANVKIESKRKNIKRNLKSYVEFKLAGARIAILGLTTDSLLYSWALKDKKNDVAPTVKNPVLTAFRYLPELRLRNDYVIVLSHLGFSADKKLVAATAGIDMVIGGHDHILINKPYFKKDMFGMKVPILQTKAHGEYVGSMLVDINPGKALKIIKYELIPVEAGAEYDPDIENMVIDAHEELYNDYGKDWLKQEVAFSEIPLETSLTHSTQWGKFIADTFKEYGKADIAIDIPEFSGIAQPPGTVTMEQVIKLYPRMFGFNNKMGWTIRSAKIRGWILYLALNEIVGQDLPVTISGASFKVYKKYGRNFIKDLKINNKNLKWWKDYKVALPEGIVEGAFNSANFFKQILKKAKDTKIPIWIALSERMKRYGVISVDSPRPTPGVFFRGRVSEDVQGYRELSSD